jgi:hypothetical protein
LSGSALSAPVLLPGLGADPGSDQTRAKSKPKAKKHLTGSPLFDAFWKVYPRKKAKKEALKAWHEVDGDAKAEQITAAIALQTANEFRFREDDRVPHAASWLRGERWTDETRPRTNGIPSAARQTRIEAVKPLTAEESGWRALK